MVSSCISAAISSTRRPLARAWSAASAPAPASERRCPVEWTAARRAAPPAATAARRNRRPRCTTRAPTGRFTRLPAPDPPRGWRHREREDRAGRQRAPVERERRQPHRLAQQRRGRDRRGRGRERQRQRQHRRQDLPQHEQDRDETGRRHRAGAERPPPQLREHAIVRRAAHRHEIQPIGRRAVRRRRDPDHRPHRVQRRAAHLVGQHALAGELRAREHVPEVRGRDVTAPTAAIGGRGCRRSRRIASDSRPATPSRPRRARRRTAHRRRRPRGPPRSDESPRPVRARTDGARRSRARWRRCPPPVARIGPPRNRGRLPRDPLDGERLRRVERSARACTDAQHAFACSIASTPRPSDRVTGETAGVTDRRAKRAWQLQRQVAFEPRDDLQMIDVGSSRAHRDQRLVVVARELQPDGRIGPRLHEDPANLLGIVGNALASSPSSVTPINRSAIRPGVATPG